MPHLHHLFRHLAILSGPGADGPADIKKEVSNQSINLALVQMVAGCGLSPSIV